MTAQPITIDHDAPSFEAGALFALNALLHSSTFAAGKQSVMEALAKRSPSTEVTVVLDSTQGFCCPRCNSDDVGTWADDGESDAADYWECQRCGSHGRLLPCPHCAPDEPCARCL